MARKRVDANQAAVVDALRKMGASVQSIASIGKGCPDLLVGYRQQNFVFEVKDGSKPPSARRLTVDEKRWIGAWKAPVYLIESPAEAVALLKMVTK